MRYADRGGQWPLEWGKPRVGEPRAESAREPSRLRLVGLRKDRDELIAAVPPDGVAAAQAVSQDLARLRENLVAEEVAVAIVDVLEVVEINEAHGQVESRPGAAIDLAIELANRRLVGQAASERVPSPDRNQLVERTPVLQAERDHGGIRLCAPEQSQAPAGPGRKSGDQNTMATGCRTDVRRHRIDERWVVGLDQA